MAMGETEETIGNEAEEYKMEGRRKKLGRADRLLLSNNNASERERVGGVGLSGCCFIPGKRSEGMSLEGRKSNSLRQDATQNPSPPHIHANRKLGRSKKNLKGPLTVNLPELLTSYYNSTRPYGLSSLNAPRLINF